MGHDVAAIHLLRLCGPGKQCEIHLTGPYRYLFGLLVAGNFFRLPENWGANRDVVEMWFLLSPPVDLPKKTHCL